LLVALNSDTSAGRLGKPGERPINALEDRLAVIAALSMVDAVTWFEDDTPAQLIAACRPEVLAKGGDWPAERIVGAKDVLARGGRLVRGKPGERRDASSRPCRHRAAAEPRSPHCSRHQARARGARWAAHTPRAGWPTRAPARRSSTAHPRRARIRRTTHPRRRSPTVASRGRYWPYTILSCASISLKWTTTPSRTGC